MAYFKEIAVRIFEVQFYRVVLSLGQNIMNNMNVLLRSF